MRKLILGLALAAATTPATATVTIYLPQRVELPSQSAQGDGPAALLLAGFVLAGIIIRKRKGTDNAV